MTFVLKELTGETLSRIFDSAFMAIRLDKDGDCVVTDDITVVVVAQPAKDLLKFIAIFGANGPRESVVEFCNRFNSSLVMVRAQVREAPDRDGEWTVVFDYDRVTFEDESIDARAIVRLARKFSSVVRSGIARCDADNVFGA